MKILLFVGLINQIFFKVVDFFIGRDNQRYAKLKGLDFRLFLNVLIDNLERVEPRLVVDYWRNMIRQNKERLNNIFKRRAKDKDKRLIRAINNNKLK